MGGNPDPARRPSWHMRWPFALAYLAVVAVGFALNWRVGLLFFAWLPLSYARYAFMSRLRRVSRPSGTRSG